MARENVELERLLTTMIAGLIDKPAEMQVAVEKVDGVWNFRLSVAETDLGKVIGKKGRTARSLRTIMSGAAMKAGVRCHLEIEEAKEPIS